MTGRRVRSSRKPACSASHRASRRAPIPAPPGIIVGVDDAVTRYCAASAAGDMEAMAATFAADVELPSPLIGSATFRGSDVRAILAIVYSTIRGVSWSAPVGDGATRLAIARATILGMHIDDAMVFELDEQGQIRRIRPHLRPLAATVLFALVVGARVAAKPMMALRILR